MTPEQLKAKQLLLGEIPFDERSAEGIGIDTSQLLPHEKLALMKKQNEWKFTDPESQANVIGAAAGGLNVPLPNLINYVGKGVSKLSQMIGGKASGLSMKEAETLSKSPKTIKALQKADPLRRQQFAEKSLQSTSKSLEDKIANESAKINSHLEGKTLPYTSEVRQIEDVAKNLNYSKAGLAPDPLMGTVSAKELDSARKFIGNKGTKWEFDPSTGALSKSQDPAVGAAYGVSKKIETEAMPEIAQSLKTQADAFEALDPISKVSSRPAGFMEQATTDTAAARQLADEAVNRTRLQRTAEQMQIAKKLNKPSGSLLGAATKESGKLLSTVGSKAGDLIGKAAPMEDLAKRLGLAHTAPVSKKPTLESLIKPADDSEWEDNDWEDDK